MDKFTLAACASHLVTAYKACTSEYLAQLPQAVKVHVNGDAPETYERLAQEVRVFGQLTISPAHNNTSIYGRDGNIAFRTCHDLGHVVHGLDFTLADETALAMVQWPKIRAHLPTEWHEPCRDVYMADTVMMLLYEQRHGAFPTDQKAFVMQALSTQ